MGDQFTYSMLDIVVGKLCMEVGFVKCKQTALDVITDVLYNYIRKLLIRVGSYTELACRTEPTVQDVLLAFKDFHIGVDDLHKYMKEYGKAPRPVKVPRYPVPRENHMNFLRPGSRELLIRPIHIHEHLPAMYTEIETDSLGGFTRLTKLNQISDSSKTEKEAVDLSLTDCTSEPPKIEEDTGLPLRELKSVLMTTGGFISSSYAGELPESQAPEKSSIVGVQSELNSTPLVRGKCKQLENKINKKKCAMLSDPTNAVGVKIVKKRSVKKRSSMTTTQSRKLDKKKQICLKRIMKILSK